MTEMTEQEIEDLLKPTLRNGECEFNKGVKVSMTWFEWKLKHLAKEITRRTPNDK